jgi:hypothetical protein
MKHGRGLFSSHSFAKGEPLLLESPLICAAIKETEESCIVCHHCLRHVGSVKALFKRAAEYWSKENNTKILSEGISLDFEIRFPECLPEEYEPVGIIFLLLCYHKIRMPLV